MSYALAQLYLQKFFAKRQQLGKEIARKSEFITSPMPFSVFAWA
jgi:hypothetical protein